MSNIRDVILAICTLSFAYALLSQVAYGFREKLGTVTVQTASITAVGLYGIAGVYLSVALWFAGRGYGTAAPQRKTAWPSLGHAVDEATGCVRYQTFGSTPDSSRSRSSSSSF